MSDATRGGRDAPRRVATRARLRRAIDDNPVDDDRRRRSGGDGNGAGATTHHGGARDLAVLARRGGPVERAGRSSSAFRSRGGRRRRAERASGASSQLKKKSEPTSDEGDSRDGNARARARDALELRGGAGELVSGEGGSHCDSASNVGVVRVCVEVVWPRAATALRIALCREETSAPSGLPANRWLSFAHVGRIVAQVAPDSVRFRTASSLDFLPKLYVRL